MKPFAPAALLVAALGLSVALPHHPQAATPRPLDIYFIDVEGGAATLMVTPAGESVLVDSGWPTPDGRDAKRIEHAARYVAGLDHIDHYVTTHWHTDHYGGIEALAKQMPVRSYWDRGIPEKSTDGAQDFPMLIEAYKRANHGQSRALQAGDTIPLRSAGRALELKIVSSNGKVLGEGDKEIPVSCSRHPAAPVPDESDNMRSLGLLLSSGRFRFLNLGDLTWNIEHKLVCPKNRIGKVDLWQVTHHGWEASSNPALLEATRPDCAVMVNGARKGASPRVVHTIKQAPSAPALYQLHLNVTTGADDNTSPERIANIDEKCQGEFFRVRLNPEGDRYTISKGADKPLQTFAVR
ncbi:MAG TPA: MBL fold metallo-hydrolase [Armatimonadota bacterium]|nr:MBL fold metallo-hydrolase [Armatimonadota bacterium]